MKHKGRGQSPRHTQHTAHWGGGVVVHWVWGVGGAGSGAGTSTSTRAQGKGRGGFFKEGGDMWGLMCTQSRGPQYLSCIRAPPSVPLASAAPPSLPPSAQ